MRYLVTGANGFIGRHLIPRLVGERGKSFVVGVDPTFAHLSETYVDARINLPFQRFFTESGHAEWKFDVVIHLAATLTKKNIAERATPSMDSFADIELDMAMARWLEANPPRVRTVWLSSCAIDAQEYENYAFCKYVGERFAQTLARKGMPVVILRPYGGYSHTQAENYPFRAILERARRREDPLTVWGSLDTTRDWIHIDDLVRAIVMAADGKFPAGAPIPLGTGRATTFEQLARMMAQTVGYEPKIEALVDKPIGSSYRVCDPRIASAFGFVPDISLEEGIRRGV